MLGLNDNLNKPHSQKREVRFYFQATIKCGFLKKCVRKSALMTHNSNKLAPMGNTLDIILS